MHQLRRVCGALMLLMLAASSPTNAQTSAAAQDEKSYNLNVSVNEVVITFHASDTNGNAIHDLKLNELRVLDNGKSPTRIIDFRLLEDLPIRAGILLDTSDSMQANLTRSRMIAMQYSQQILQRQTDQAFVMDFGRISSVQQPLTSDPAALAAALRKAPPPAPSGIHGTAIFDAVLRACLYGFGQVDQAATGNFILLFSDGEDNASYVSLKDAVNTCQRTNTAIYAFRTEPQNGEASTGPSTLAELTTETGGRVFTNHDSAEESAADLRAIEADLRNQYRLVYKPAALHRNGSFHRIELQTPERVDTISIRSGYYAPER